MTVATSIVSPGQANSTGSVVGLNLRVFAGEVLAKLDDKLILMNAFETKRALAGAKVASFPVYGDAGANYHTPGEDIILDASADTTNYLQSIAVGERLIYADRILQSSIFLDELEEKLNHWDHRSAFAGKLATAIGEKVEDNLFRLIVSKTPQGTDIDEWEDGTATPGANGGDQVTAATVYDHIWTAAQGFDEASLPQDGRYAIVDAADFNALLRLYDASTATIDAVLQGDFVRSGVNGDMAKPNKMGVWIGGVFVMWSNLIPTTDTSSDTYNRLTSGEGNAYQADMTLSTTSGQSLGYRLLAWHKSAIGTVRVREPRVDVNYIPERLGHLITLSQSMGHGVLRQEGLYSMYDTDSDA